MATKTLWIWPAGATLLAVLPMLTGGLQLATVARGLAGEAVPAESAQYVAVPLPIALHIGAGLVFFVLGGMQFWRALRRRAPRWHRAAGGLFIASGLVLAATGLWMNQFYSAFGGVSKYLALWAVGLALPVFLALAVRAIIRGDRAAHRAWMIRAFAIGLGTGMQRLLLVPWFIVFGIPAGEVLGILIWGCWILTLALAEWAIRGGPATGVRSPVDGGGSRKVMATDSPTPDRSELRLN